MAAPLPCLLALIFYLPLDSFYWWDFQVNFHLTWSIIFCIASMFCSSVFFNITLYWFYIYIITLFPHFTHLLFAFYWKILVFFEIYKYVYTILLTSKSRFFLNYLHQESLLWDGHFWRRHVVVALYITFVSALESVYQVTCVLSAEASPVFKGI